MQIEPSAESFAARYAAGEPQVVWTTLVADLETPVSAFLKVAGARPGASAPMSFLLELVEGGAVRGRYSIIGLEPDLIFRVNGKHAEINRDGRRPIPAAFVPADDAPLTALRALIAESRIALPAALPPMAAGVFGYLGYDMVRLMEDLPPPGPIRSAFPTRSSFARRWSSSSMRSRTRSPSSRRCGRRPAIDRKGGADARRSNGCRPSSMRSTGRSTNRPPTSMPVRSRSSRARTPRRTNSSAW